MKAFIWGVNTWDILSARTAISIG